MEYFTLSRAKRLIAVGPALLNKMKDSRLQKHIVMLIDFERYTKDTHLYRDILSKGSYFNSADTHASSGVVPKDMWLSQNLSTVLNEALKEKKRRINNN